MKRSLLIFFASIVSLSTPAYGLAATYSLVTLVDFNGTNGKGPYGNLLQDASGNLYGTTAAGGGASGNGTVFKIDLATHSLTTLATFNGTNGANPNGNLAMGSDGSLYGTTSSGGANYAGTAFKIVAGSNTLSTLYEFDGNGSTPRSGLLIGSDGTLFGTTLGAFPAYNTNRGSVFKISADTNQFSTIFAFDGTNGEYPWAGLIADSEGNIYGTTSGLSGVFDFSLSIGTVFEIAAGTGNLSTLATFNNSNGGFPRSDLVADIDGNLYGTTLLGGRIDLNTGAGFGTVFMVSAVTHELTTLYMFDGLNGAYPYGSILIDGSGNLFGTASGADNNGHGIVFEIAAGTHELTTLFAFNGANGAYPHAGLIADADGNLYGTTAEGGASNAGTVFMLKKSVPEVHSLILAPLALTMLTYLLAGRSHRTAVS